MRKLLNKLIAAVSAAAVAIAGVNFGGIGGLNLTARAETPGTLDISASDRACRNPGYVRHFRGQYRYYRDRLYCWRRS